MKAWGSGCPYPHTAVWKACVEVSRNQWLRQWMILLHQKGERGGHIENYSTPNQNPPYYHEQITTKAKRQGRITF